MSEKSDQKFVEEALEHARQGRYSSAIGTNAFIRDTKRQANNLKNIAYEMGADKE